MTNMRMLIRIVFVIFIANGNKCLGGVCDNCCDDCCDCFKEEIKEYEEIKDEGNITAKTLISNDWYYAKEKNKENDLVLKIFKKKDDKAFPSTDNKYKISIKSNEEGNHKIAYQNESKQELKLEGKKYALFEIKTQEEENTIYLYCSDVESYEKDYGIFEHMDHISISVIACDTTNVKNMRYMFYECSSLTKLDLNNFNTTNVTDMHSMFYECRSLTELDLKNFNTTKVTDMGCMFYECSKLENLKFRENFNTSNVTTMNNMFYKCSSLTKLDLKNFNTTKVTGMRGMFGECSSLRNLDLSNFNTTNVTDMHSMFSGCSSLKNLNISNFNTENVMYEGNMFSGCNSFPENIQNKNVEEIINFFKEKNK